MTLVAELGNVGIWRGRLVRPRARAGSLNQKVLDYIYKENGQDWALVARRLEEVAQVTPANIGTAAELGNAWLRLGQAAPAIRAYRRPLQQREMPLDATVAAQFEAQIARVQAAQDPRSVPPMRNPWME